MWSQLFVERYAREKHQAHLSEAAHDRLPRDLRVALHTAQNRPPRVLTAPVRASGAMVILVLASGFSVGLGGVLERLTTPAMANASVVEASEARPHTSFAHVVDRWYDEPEMKPAAGSSLAHVVDRYR